jgi:hypothetical protein
MRVILAFGQCQSAFHEVRVLPVGVAVWATVTSAPTDPQAAVDDAELRRLATLELYPPRVTSPPSEVPGREHCDL